MFLGIAGDWGTVWDVNTLVITGVPMFDYMFTLVVVFALISFMCGSVFRIISRS
jgi:hypothetical protein